MGTHSLLSRSHARQGSAASRAHPRSRPRNLPRRPATPARLESDSRADARHPRTIPAQPQAPTPSVTSHPDRVFAVPGGRMAQRGLEPSCQLAIAANGKTTRVGSIIKPREDRPGARAGDQRVISGQNCHAGGRGFESRRSRRRRPWISRALFVVSCHAGTKTTRWKHFATLAIGR
jgi:hypothetical protein